MKAIIRLQDDYFDKAKLLKTTLFRVKRKDGKYWAPYYVGDVSNGLYPAWSHNQLNATRWDRHRTTPEQIVKAFDWILGVDVTAEDAEDR